MAFLYFPGTFTLRTRNVLRTRHSARMSVLSFPAADPDPKPYHFGMLSAISWDPPHFSTDFSLQESQNYRELWSPRAAHSR